MKRRFWIFLFVATEKTHAAVMWLACWSDFIHARCAFRAMGNFKFNNTRHNFARFETVNASETPNR